MLHGLNPVVAHKAHEMLVDMPMFAGISPEELSLIEDKCVVEKWTDGIVIEEGGIGDKLYLIVEGNVEISKYNPSYGQVNINTLGPGSFFGEIAILRKIPRTARVSIKNPCLFLTITAEDFLNIYQTFSPHSRDNIQIIIAKRLTQLKDMGFKLETEPL